VIGTYWADVNWSDLSAWWLSELESDPAYAEVVTPLLLEIFEPQGGRMYLDIGCGDGRVMKQLSDLGVITHGLDLSHDLAHRAGSAVVGDAIRLPMRDDTYDGVYSVLTLEHVVEHDRFMAEAARVTRSGGVLALVVNHPVWTAPDATPISDQFGEVLWRPGGYFTDGCTEMPAGDSSVIFHHRSMSVLLNAAADAGWSLEKMVEQPHHEYEDQAGIPRLLAVRWRLLP
jgi:SAM-dependent methyltransferase